MDCIISPKNALILDKLMKTIKSNDLVIDTTSRILFQMVSDDKTKCCNLVFEDSFFISIKAKKKLMQISKPKFFIKKMKVLRMFTYDNVMVFEYEFEDYTYRHRFFIYETSIYHLVFNSSQSSPFDHNVLLEVLKQVHKEVRMEIKDGFAYLTNEENVIKFKCCDLSDVGFDVCLSSFKTILSTCKVFNEALLCWEGEDCPINLVFRSSNIQISYFLAV
ncbi:hypothetical protein NGRA_2162 [Nosema granulosis]|uniref:Uncharacterized protein n=1 Tax=Nosema granulosis TaxID=83296 RepID=A0A9P6GZW4_9MICR|nr:hypothetical protein NGRA_2162 [Nosema granulosis]